MKVLFVGGLPWHRPSSTNLNRFYAMQKVVSSVDYVNTLINDKGLFQNKIRYKLFTWGLPVKMKDQWNTNAQIIEKINNNEYDIVWIDKGWVIESQTLRYIKTKSPKTNIVSFSPDNMALRHNQSQQYLECVPLYDYIVTNKSYIIDDMYKLGAKKMLFVNNTYENTFHHPRDLTSNDYGCYGGDVGFVGAWEKERCESILYLADNGIHIRVFGVGRWKDYMNYSPYLHIEEYCLRGEDYCKALQAFKISLCFLRKINYDQQTTRSVEIPACGGFMMAERTAEHKMMFEEDKEAVYFSTNGELLEKCRYYLLHEDERLRIALAGHQRCLDSDYSNEGMIRKVLNIISQE